MSCKELLKKLVVVGEMEHLLVDERVIRHLANVEDCESVTYTASSLESCQ